MASAPPPPPPELRRGRAKVVKLTEAELRQVSSALGGLLGLVTVHGSFPAAQTMVVQSALKHANEAQGMLSRKADLT